jgi:hypothetical protein
LKENKVAKQHINDLSQCDLQQEIAVASNQLALSSVFGNKSAQKRWDAYQKALWARLKEIAPLPETSEDELLAELLA